MKKSSDDLFLLIKSLKKNEKRYFRLFSSFHGGNKNYMLMFNAIDKQKTYNEKEIISLFRREKIASQFPLIKRYLYTLILSSLRGYRTSVESTLYNHLQNISILDEKRLYPQCKKVIKIAKQLAIKYDLQLPLLELMKWEVKLIGKQSFIGAPGDKIRQIFNDIFSSIEQYKTTNEYLLFNHLLFLMAMTTGNIRSHSDIKALEGIMPAHPNLSRLLGQEDFPSLKTPAVKASAIGATFPLERNMEKEQTLSFQSLHLFYTAYGAYFFIQNNYENADICERKLMQLWDANPHQIIENPLQYALVIRNLFTGKLYMKKYRECAEIIVKLKRVPVKTVIEKMEIDFLIDEMNLMLCLETGEFNKGLPMIQSMKGKWDKMDVAMISKGKILAFQYNAAYLYFGIGNYHKANEYLNKILNESIDIRNDDQCFARIVSLIVHFELGNQDLLEYKVKSVHRFLSKKERLYKLETIILDFIRKEVPKIHSDKELLNSFEILLTKMKAIANDPFERRAFDYFDLISWLESKIQGRPFGEVVREKCTNE